MENSTIDTGKHKTFRNREIKEEESVPGHSSELVCQADGDGNEEKENPKEVRSSIEVEGSSKEREESLEKRDREYWRQYNRGGRWEGVDGR
jgi:hypothetical protein